MQWSASLGLIILSISASTQAADVRVDRFWANSDCGLTPDYDVIETSALDPNTNRKGESLRVFFNNFFLSTQKSGQAAKNCALDAQIRIPAGFRFRPVSAAAEGSYNLQPNGQSQGFIRVSYEVQPEGWTAEASNDQNPFTGQGDIRCIAELDSQFQVSCSEYDTELTLHTNIDLRIQQDSTLTSQMDIDATRQNHDLSWKWELSSCSVPFEEHSFQSNFIAYDGSSVAATLNFSGSTGSFRTANFVGTFTKLVYSHGGRTIKGHWSASGSNGTFTFELLNNSTGDFQGTWKDGKDPKQNGFWNGRYL